MSSPDHANGFELQARDATGLVGSSNVPPSDTRSPHATDRLMPIFVSTISTHEDFTKVLGVEGPRQRRGRDAS